MKLKMFIKFKNQRIIIVLAREYIYIISLFLNTDINILFLKGCF